MDNWNGLDDIMFYLFAMICIAIIFVYFVTRRKE